MKQYELRWASLPPPVGRRPVLLLTPTSALAYLNKVIVAEITSRAIDVKRALGHVLAWPELQALRRRGARRDPRAVRSLGET